LDEDIVEFNLKITTQMETVKVFFCWITCIYTSFREDVVGRGKWKFCSKLS